MSFLHAIFSHEFKFNIFNINERIRLWSRKYALNPRYTTKTAKHVVRVAMIWFCKSDSGV